MSENDLAFPSFKTTVYGQPRVSGGLTKREYFAAMALQGLLASYNDFDITEYCDFAHDAVLAADSLIKALQVQP